MDLQSHEVRKLINLIEDSFRVRKNVRPIYVDVGDNLARLGAPQHQVIFGRRGSGKSCLLVEYLAGTSQSTVTPIYILADEFKRLAYPDILIRLLVEILEAMAQRRPWYRWRLRRPSTHHIIHVDRLPSVISDGYLWSDADMAARPGSGTTIGMSSIKERRLHLSLACRPGLHVGECVPFYFCPRSVMLYVIHCANKPELSYCGGQEPIVHLEADLGATVRWAQQNGMRWAFTLSNAGARYFEDRCDLDQLNEVNWPAVQATEWSGRGVSSLVKEGKQAEFLVERRFPWELVERVGIHSQPVAQRVLSAVQGGGHRPRVETVRGWYY